jgi:uncharacterized protein YndB with AHSA1/START domain
MFEVGATGGPEQVWAILTTPESTRRFLFGISLESTWTPGATITGRLDDTPMVWGEVLFAGCPNRLSYVLGAGPEQPGVYVTWEVEEDGPGATVRLCVDEFDPGDRDALEASWQPVVTALQGLLSVQPS